MFQPLLSAGERVNGYVVLHYIGHGMSGEVYYVHNERSDRVFAMKIEKKKSSMTLPHECRLLKDLKTPYVAKILAYGHVDDFRYIIEEPLGVSLAKFMEKTPRINQMVAVELAKETLNCLKHLHANNILHNDFKPGNVCLRPRSNVPCCLIDLGISYYDREPDTMQKAKNIQILSFNGTLRYAPPATHQLVPCSPKDDLYSWFYTVLELFGRKLPWAKLKNIDAVGEIKINIDPKRLCKGMPKQLEEIYSLIQTYNEDSIIDYDVITNTLDKIYKLSQQKAKALWENIMKPFSNEMFFVPDKTTQMF